MAHDGWIFTGMPLAATTWGDHCKFELLPGPTWGVGADGAASPTYAEVPPTEYCGYSTGVSTATITLPSSPTNETKGEATLNFGHIGLMSYELGAFGAPCRRPAKPTSSDVLTLDECADAAAAVGIDMALNATDAAAARLNATGVPSDCRRNGPVGEFNVASLGNDELPRFGQRLCKTENNGGSVTVTLNGGIIAIASKRERLHIVNFSFVAGDVLTLNQTGGGMLIRELDLHTWNPPVNTSLLGIVLDEVDNVTAKLDTLEEKLFNSTLLISGIEGDAGAYGLQVGDYDNEAIPFEFLLRTVHRNVTLLADDSVVQEQTISTERGEAERELTDVRTVGTRADAAGVPKELITNVTTTLTEVRQVVVDTNPKVAPLLARVDAVTAAFEHAREMGVKATTDGVGGRAVRAGFDRLRTSIRRAGAVAAQRGIPSELKPGAVVARLE